MNTTRFFKEISHDRYTGFSTMQDGRLYQVVPIAGTRDAWEVCDNETGERYPVLTAFQSDEDVCCFECEDPDATRRAAEYKLLKCEEKLLSRFAGTYHVVEPDLKEMAQFMQHIDPNGEYDAEHIYEYPEIYIELLDQWCADLNGEDRVLEDKMRDYAVLLYVIKH